MDISNFYTHNDLQDYQYMKFAMSEISQEIIDEYNLKTIVHEAGYCYIEISTGYLRALSKGNRADQKSFSVMKDRGRENTTGLYGLHNLAAQYNPKDFYPSKVELQSQQAFGKSNSLKSYTVLPVVIKTSYARLQ